MLVLMRDGKVKLDELKGCDQTGHDPYFSYGTQIMK